MTVDHDSQVSNLETSTTIYDSMSTHWIIVFMTGFFKFYHRSGDIQYACMCAHTQMNHATHLKKPPTAI